MAHECWAINFVSDQSYKGKRIRALTVLDQYTRECLIIYVDKAIKGETVASVLDRLKVSRGLPQRIKVDNGPEFISRALGAWAYFNHVKLDHSRPGTPTDNTYIESFSGSFRNECLNTKKPTYLHDILFCCLYNELKTKVPDLDKRIVDYTHALRQQRITIEGGSHDLLFFLKSLDLDFRCGYKLGTVCGYGRDEFK